MTRFRGPGALDATEALGRVVLVGLLLVLALSAAALDRRQRWPAFVGDEATYLMAAESLARDFDLRYERGDYERFVQHWDRRPEGLILQSGDRGATLTYGKPFLYPVYLAAFVRWAPVRGAPFANSLLLAAAALFVARRLRPVLGGAAPWWTAAFVFASVVWTYAYWAHSDLFLMALSAFGLGLALPEDGDSERARVFGDRRRLWRTALSGALLGAVAYSRPVYLPLLLPAAAFLPRADRRRHAVALAAGAAGVALALGAVHLSLAGAWTSYGAERGGFYSATGFPEVDFPASEWAAALERGGNMAWGSWLFDEARRSVSGVEGLRLLAWNVVYLIFGRDVGLLPYFLPAALGLLAWPRDRTRLLLPVAVAISLAGILVLRPFNFFGGGAAIANRYFLPLYPALWLMVGRRRSALWALLAALLAAPFLWPLWRQGGDYPRTPERTWAYVSAAAESWLPYETTQSHLKPSGQEDVVAAGLWVKLLTPRVESLGAGVFRVAPRDSVDLLVGSYRPLGAVVFDVEAYATSGAGAAAPRRPGGRAFRRRIELGGPTARHPMWWSRESLWLYRVRTRFDSDAQEPLVFRLRPAPEGRLEGPPGDGR